MSGFHPLPAGLWSYWQKWKKRRLPDNLPAPIYQFFEQLEPSLHGEIAHAELLAVDLEMTSLSPDDGEIVAVGIVPITALGINLSGAKQWLVKPQRGVGESAVHHQLTDQALTEGEPLAQVMEAFFEAATGKVLLAHHAHLDLGFLRKASQQLWGVKMPLPFIDTLEMGAYLQRKQHPHQPLRRLRLSELRHDYGLPPHFGHNALADAIACGELFLALLSHGYQQPVKTSALISAR
ncbi:3'-5' exonuclease [Corallincola platygyrae]|uniref:DNA-directed DNA polymerase n=1 Tax=Corallincola platygyrae TaxID=1193278 RepID=A0ABW4XHK3_9GAMM